MLMKWLRPFWPLLRWVFMAPASAAPWQYGHWLPSRYRIFRCNASAVSSLLRERGEVVCRRRSCVATTTTMVTMIHQLGATTDTDTDLASACTSAAEWWTPPSRWAPPPVGDGLFSTPGWHRQPAFRNSPPNLGASQCMLPHELEARFEATDSPYCSGPSKDWIKVKCAHWRGANNGAEISFRSDSHSRHAITTSTSPRSAYRQRACNWSLRYRHDFEIVPPDFCPAAKSSSPTAFQLFLDSFPPPLRVKSRDIVPSTADTARCVRASRESGSFTTATYLRYIYPTRKSIRYSLIDARRQLHLGAEIGE